MSRKLRCRDPEFLKSVIGSEEVLVFLYGDVIVMARSEEDVQRFLYAETLPKSIPLKVINELRCEEVSISIAKLCSETLLVLADIVSTDMAHIIGHKLAQVFRDYTPFAIRRIDVVTSYSSSEDGGYVVRNQVVLSLDTRFIDEQSALSIARRAVEELLKAWCKK